MSKKEVHISPFQIGFVLLLLVFAPIAIRCVKTVNPGYVAVATFFGEVQQKSYGPGLHFPVNPLLSFTEFDARNKEHKETARCFCRAGDRRRRGTAGARRLPKTFSSFCWLFLAFRLALMPVLIEDQQVRCTRTWKTYRKQSWRNLGIYIYITPP